MGRQRRLRLGYLVAPDWLLYATGGVSWLRAELGASCTSSGAWCIVSNSQTNSVTRTGWTAGGGVEVKIWQNWLLRGEYRYADYGHASFGFFPTQASGQDFVGGNVHITPHTGLIGLAYAFGGPH